MERSTINLSVILHEEILLDDPPSGIGNVLHSFLVFFRDILPAEECAILADSVNLWIKISMVFPEPISSKYLPLLVSH